MTHQLLKPLVKPVIVMDSLLFAIELPGIIKKEYLDEVNVLINLWWILSQGFPGGASGKESACQWRRCQRLWFNPERPGLDSCIGNSHRIPILVTRSSSLAWKIPWTEESEGLQSMASQCQTWLRRHASYRHKYWANFFMSPYTPDLKHNSSTRSKNFQTLPLRLTIFFFLYFDPNIDETQTGTWLLPT